MDIEQQRRAFDLGSAVFHQVESQRSPRAPPFSYIVLLAVALMFVYLYIQSIIELIDNEREKRRM